MVYCYFVIRYFGKNSLDLVPESWLLVKQATFPFCTLTYYDTEDMMQLPPPVHAHILLLADRDNCQKSYGRSYRAEILMGFCKDKYSIHCIKYDQFFVQFE